MITKVLGGNNRGVILHFGRMSGLFITFISILVFIFRRSIRYRFVKTFL